jgi:APA family basic amino acid/polyamine antiporter
MPTAPRRFGVWKATALVVGNIIGAGIFMLPRDLAPYGWTAVGAWGLAVAGALGCAWVFARLFARFPDAGGVHGILTLGVGPRAAFVGSWGYLVSVWAANATLAISGVEYLARVVPLPTAIPWLRPTVALGAVAVLLVANLRGRGGDVQLVSTAVKLLPLVAVLGLAALLLVRDGTAVLSTGGVTTSGSPTGMAPSAFSLSALLAATSLTLYAMLGIESAAIPADLVEDAPRVVPRATMFGTALSGAIGLLVTCAVTLLLPGAAGSDAPLADFVAWQSVPSAGILVALCAIVSCFGCLNGYLLVGAELTAAMADDGELPAVLGRRNAVGVAPAPLWLGAAVTTLLILAAYTATSAFKFAALVTTATNLVLYLLALTTAARFLRDGRLPRTPGLVVACVGGAVFSALALVGAGGEALGWGAALVVAGIPLGLVARQRARSTRAA